MLSVRYFPACLIFILGTLSSVWGYVLLEKWEQDHIRSEFDSTVKVQLAAIDTIFNESILALDALTVFFEESDFVSREEFQTFSSSFLVHIQGVQALSWVPRVSRALRSSMEEKARQEGLKNFVITERNSAGQLIPAKVREEYFPVSYLVPLQANETALGFDIVSNAIRKSGVDKAWQTGTPVATGRITLVQEKESQFGFLLFKAVYAQGKRNFANLQERREALQGVISVVYRGGDFLQSALGREGAQGIGYYFHDVSVSEQEEFLHAHGARAQDYEVALQGLHQLVLRSLGGRVWRITAVAQPEFVARFSSQGADILLGTGILISFLSAGVVWILINKAKDVEQLVHVRTQELKASEQRFDLALRGGEMSLWEWDIPTDEVYYDPAWGQTRNASAPQKQHFSKWEQTIDHQHRQSVRDILFMTQKSDSPEHFEVEYKAHSSQQMPLWILLRGQVVKRDDQGFALRMTGVVQDLSRRREMEEALREAHDSAHEANKAKSMLLANMSHEIRTPMNGIIGLTDLALEDLALPNMPPQKQQAYLKKIQYAAKRLLGIINDILDFSKIEAGHIELEQVPFDLCAILENIIAMHQWQVHQKPVTLNLEIAAEVPHFLLGDGLRLEQVLTNLVSNAIKFTPQGEVTLTVQQQQADEYSSLLSFAVRDTGIGIAPKDQHKLFESFRQLDGSTSRLYGGTGLGLTIAGDLVALMGGEIHIDSTPGTGSTFSFACQFPHASRERLASAVDASSASVSVPEDRDFAAEQPAVIRFDKAPAPRILVVEDNAINREIAVEILRRAGCEVQVAVNGAQAVETLCADAAADAGFHAVLMDVQMPVMDGMEATRSIREKKCCQGIPIIAMTAHAMQGDREMCLQAGMDDYITKPLDKEQLFTKLNKWLTGTGQDTEKNGRTQQETTQQDLQLQYPGIDTQTGLQRLEGNTVLYTRLLNQFLADLKEKEVKIQQALQGGTTETAWELTHTLKGEAGNIGAMSLFAACEALEQELRSTSKPAPDRHTQALTAAIQELINNAPVPATQERQQKQVEAVTGHKTLKEEHKQQLSTLYSLVCNHEFRALAFFEELRPVLETCTDRARLAGLASHMNAFDYKESAKELEFLAQQLAVTLPEES